MIVIINTEVNSMEIKKVGVIGSGSMGAGIAYVAALSKYDVKVFWRREVTRDECIATINWNREKNVTKGVLTQEESDALMSRIEYANTYDEFVDCDLVIESIVEIEDVKVDLIGKLDQILAKDAIIATNTSSFSITGLANACTRQDKFVGTHFFYPVPVMRLLEIIRGFHTSDETVAIIQDVAKRMNKTSVLVKRDSPGFLVNRLMLVQFKEAITLLEQGVASAEDIDIALELGLNHRMGPFALMDATGVDIADYVMSSFHEQLGENFRPPQLLKRMARAGMHGKKSGRGWFDYT
jgi:3-hydroxybutyryl-CoA dehydrogenase